MKGTDCPRGTGARGPRRCGTKACVLHCQQAHLLGQVSLAGFDRITHIHAPVGSPTEITSQDTSDYPANVDPRHPPIGVRVRQEPKPRPVTLVAYRLMAVVSLSCEEESWAAISSSRTAG